MNKFYKFCDYGKSFFFPFLSIFLLILITKQIGVFDKIVDIYESVLPVFYGVIIAFLYQPIIDRLSKHFSYRISVSIVYFGVFLLLIVFMFFLVPLLYNQLIHVFRILPEWMIKLENFMNDIPYVHMESDTIEKMVHKDGYGVAMNVMSDSFKHLTKFGIAYFSAFFISIDLDFWIRSLKKILPDFHRFHIFYKTMSNVVYLYLTGTLIDMMFIIVSNGIVLSLIGFPNALMYAIIMALFNLFPYIGPTIGFLVILLAGILSFETVPWIALLVIWVIQQLEANIVQPFIFHKTMDIRPLLIFVSIFLFEALFGVIGIILSPIFASIIQIGFRSYIHSKTTDKVGKWEDIWYDFDEIIAKYNENV